MTWERRAIGADGLATEGMALTLRALPFDSESRDLGGFVEVIPSDIRISYWEGDAFLLHNHNWDLVLARMGAGTMDVEHRDDGIYVRGTLAESEFSRGLMQSVERGDIGGASFSFSTDKDEWAETGGRTVRTLREITLREFSTTPIPAYADTDVGVAMRSLLSFSEGRQRDIGEHQRAAMRAQIEAGKLPAIYEEVAR